MGPKYLISCKKYPSKGYVEYQESTPYFFILIILLLKAMTKYEIIDISIRNIKG